MSQNYLLASNQGYDLFLKEAVRTGMHSGMNVGPWKNNVNENFGQLKNVAPDYESFVEQIFPGCTQFVRDPFDPNASCPEQNFVPQHLRDKIAVARRARDDLDRNCDHDSVEVKRCERAIFDARHSFPTARLDQYTQRMSDAKESHALGSITAACEFNNPERTLALRVTRASQCAEQLRNKDDSKRQIAKSRESLAREVEWLDRELGEANDILELSEDCGHRKRLMAVAVLANVPFSECQTPPPTEAVELERALKERRGGDNKTSLPKLAQAFESACLEKRAGLRSRDAAERDDLLNDSKVKAGDYVKSCSKALATLIENIKAFQLRGFSTRPNSVAGSGIDDPPYRGDPPSQGDFISADELLHNWTERRNDRSLVPGTARAIADEAKLVAEIFNHRGRSIVRYLAQCANGEAKKEPFPWFGKAATLDKVIAHVEDLLKSDLSKLLDASTKQRVAGDVADWRVRAKTPCPPAGAVAKALPSDEQTPPLRPTQTEGQDQSGRQTSTASPGAEADGGLPLQPVVTQACMDGGRPSVTNDCIWALDNAYQPNRTVEEIRKENLIIKVQNDELAAAIVHRANELLEWRQDECQNAREIASGLDGITRLFDYPTTWMMYAKAKEIRRSCNLQDHTERRR